MMITLEEITRNNLHAVLNLQVSAAQLACYPRSNAYSIAEGTFPPDDDTVWMRAICNDGVPIGFMMTSEAQERGEYFLWRMMIDHRFQRMGFGEEAMHCLIRRIRQSGNERRLLLSHHKDNLEAGRFYEKLGFNYTDQQIGNGDLEMTLLFNPPSV